MSEKLETLSKNLAGGMSRRRAFWQFITGLGVVGALSGRKAQAGQGNGGCVNFCELQAAAFLSFCVAASSTCKPGWCAEITLIKGNPTSTVNFNGGGGGPFICVPVGIV